MRIRNRRKEANENGNSKWMKKWNKKLSPNFVRNMRQVQWEWKLINLLKFA